MGQQIRITGWAGAGGKPQLIAQLTATFSLRLSDHPDQAWQAAFRWVADRVMAEHPNVSYTLMG